MRLKNSHQFDAMPLIMSTVHCKAFTRTTTLCTSHTASSQRISHPRAPLERRRQYVVHFKHGNITTFTFAVKKPESPEDPDLRNKRDTPAPADEGLPARFLSFWGRLSLQQRVTTVLAGAVALWLLPSLLVLLVVALERVLVGGMLAAEQAFVAAIISSAAAVGGIALVGLVCYGVYLLVISRLKPEIKG